MTNQSSLVCSRLKSHNASLNKNKFSKFEGLTLQYSASKAASKANQIDSADLHVDVSDGSLGAVSLRHLPYRSRQLESHHLTAAPISFFETFLVSSFNLVATVKIHQRHHRYTAESQTFTNAPTKNSLENEYLSGQLFLHVRTSCIAASSKRQ
jgi:hypothetical protein